MPMTDSTGAKPNIRLALLPLLSVIGASSSIYLAKHYYDLRSGTAGFKSLCNISATMNCDAVTSSRFAEIVPGLPLASLVAGWFLALLIFGIMARVTEWRREAVLISTIMSGFGSLYSLGLLIVMAVLLQKYCLFCLVIDAVNFALFGVCLSLASAVKTTSVFGGARWPKIQSNALIALGCMLVTVVILRPADENQMTSEVKAEIQAAVAEVLAQTPVEVKAPEGVSTFGNSSAPITIYEFSDFQCPFCKRGAVVMNQLLSRYEGKIKLVFMPFPLDNSCNRLITHPMHPYSCALSRSAYCAGKSGKFQPVYEKFFENQELLTADSAAKIPAELGLGADAMKACMESEDAKKALSRSIEEGIRLKVDSTPTFFVNGKKVVLSLPLEAWDQIIAGLK